MSAPKQKFRVESFAIDRSNGRIKDQGNEHGRWREGDVVTRFGIVGIYSDENYSRYDFAWRGRHYMQSEDRARTKLGLAIEAGKFARRIASSRTGGRRT